DPDRGIVQLVNPLPAGMGGRELWGNHEATRIVGAIEKSAERCDRFVSRGDAVALASDVRLAAEKVHFPIELCKSERFSRSHSSGCEAFKKEQLATGLDPDPRPLPITRAALWNKQLRPALEPAARVHMQLLIHLRDSFRHS